MRAAAHRPTLSPAEWAAMIGDVAGALPEGQRGVLSKRSARELRFGRRGSLSVRLDTGQWHDHEAGAGRGTLDLVRHVLGCDRAAALDWLMGAGFVERPPSRGESGSGALAQRAHSPVTAPDRRIAMVRVLGARAGHPDRSPGRDYLARRMVWPPSGIGPDLPATVRWLAAAAAPAMDRPAKWYGLPAGAAGALVFAWRTPDALAAVSLIAVTNGGERVRWFARRDRLGAKVMTLGARSGALFEARPGPADETLHVAESELDALALSIAPWVEPGRVVACGGTGGIKAALGTGPVVVHGDGDGGGRTMGTAARFALPPGHALTVERYGPGEDPASTLAADIGERAALRGCCETECTAAPACPWRDCLPDDGDGGPEDDDVA